MGTNRGKPLDRKKQQNFVRNTCKHPYFTTRTMCGHDQWLSTWMPTYTKLLFYHGSTLTCPRVPGPPVFLRATLKNWEWPGDEATRSVHCVLNICERSAILILYRMCMQEMAVAQSYYMFIPVKLNFDCHT